MSHESQQAFVASVRERFPDYFKGTRVYEIGSLIINGSVREFFTDCEYWGIDVVPGPGVDISFRAGAHVVLAAMGECDVAISCEAAEHDIHWQKTLAAMHKALRPGGLMVITCAGPGRPEHGTARTTPQDAPGLPWDYYKNLSLDDLREVLTEEMFSERVFDSNVYPADSYFAGLKR